LTRRVSDPSSWYAWGTPSADVERDGQRIPEGDHMAELPAEMVPCAGSGLPTDVVDDVTGHVRSYMCSSCGAAMTKLRLAPSHPARLD
jgi:hypothetical protein